MNSKEIIDSIDSLSPKDLLISDFIAQKKSRIGIYLVCAVILAIAIYALNAAKVNSILGEKRASTSKVFTHSELWQHKAEIPFLKTGKFREDALNKIVPILKNFVQNNNLQCAYILDSKSTRVLAHNDIKLSDAGNLDRKGYEEIFTLMDNQEIDLGKDPTGEAAKTAVTMAVLSTGDNLVLKTSASILYGKNKTEIGTFAMEELYDPTQARIDNQKRYFPLAVVLLIIALPAVLVIEYYQQANEMEADMAGYEEGYLGPYKNVKFIGSGSMGKVYQADRILNGKRARRKVAVKVLNENLYSKKDFLARFNNEASIVAKLGLHPNIVGIYEFGQVRLDGTESIGFEMPFIEGITLEKLIEKYNKDISDSHALYICLGILNGLSHAHNLADKDTNEPTPVIHRDISPKNIMLSFDGGVYITDFGIAKSSESSQGTIVGSLIGTFANMSPEQANSEEADCRSDIFSLGTILYELILKRKPYDTKDIRTLWNLVSNARIAEITGIDAQLEKIIRKSLAKNPDERYQSASAMMQAINELMNQNYQGDTFDEKRMGDFLISRRDDLSATS